MSRQLKQFLWVGLLAATLVFSAGFTLLGPNNEAFQVNTIGYMLSGDLGTPKDFNQEYRRNTPTMYYACDGNFYLFFGDKGVSAIDSAFAVFNALSPVDCYSTNLDEFPYQSMRKNWQAQALSMYDLKTLTLSLLVEQMGLAQPARFTWGLHDRYLTPNTTCPAGENYLIVKRNFDPVSYMASSYVNNVLLTYQLQDLCTAANPPTANTYPFAVDPMADLYTAVAEQNWSYGDFYTGLTRDDLGGLRYLWRTNNVNYESAGTNATVAVTNTTPTLLTGTNLNLLAAQATTNNAATLQGLFSGLTIVSSTSYYTNVYTTTITTNYGNFPWDPVGTPGHPIYVTNTVGTPTLYYQHTFGNVFYIQQVGNAFFTVPLLTIPPATNQVAVTVDTTIVSTGGRVDACTFDFLTGNGSPWQPVGTNAALSTNVFTNICSMIVTTNAVVGEIFILPTNICGLQILASQITNVTSITNALLTNTTYTATNGGVTISSASQNAITYFTNRTLLALEATCGTADTPTLRQGIGKIDFVRLNYDSLTGRFIAPVTNDYILYAVTNYQIVAQQVQRVVSAPDFLFTATDMTAGPAAGPPNTNYATVVSRNINFNQGNVPANLAGPGTIEPATTFTFNNATPVFYNTGLADTNSFLSELTQSPLFVYATFDGSTNAPTVYPDYVSLNDVEQQMLVQVNASLPQGAVGQLYYGTLQVVSSTPGFQPPFVWSVMPGSPALPPGLTIMTADDGAGGIITGVPTREATYDFMVRVADTQGHTVDRNFKIKVGL